MTTTTPSETAGAGRRFAEQAAAFTQLLAEMQQTLADCMPAQGASAASDALVSQQRALTAAAQGLVSELAAAEAALELSREEQRMLTRRLVQVQEDERRALARDLHDTTGGAMTVLGIGLALLKREAGCAEGSLKRIDQLHEMAATVGEDLHRLSVNLRPSSLDRYGLTPALEELLRALGQQTGVTVDFAAEGLDVRLPGDVETALYRIVQEACTNIARYAAAQHVHVRLHRDAGVVSLLVEDDGRGFDVAAAQQGNRLGLLGMRERAEMFGGTLTINSAPGRGAKIAAYLPLRAGVDARANVDLSGLSKPDRSGLLDRSDVGASVDLSGLSKPDRSGLLDRSDVLDRSGAQPDPLAEAAELARSKALSDALVDILADLVQQPDAAAVLDAVLAATVRAIGCQFAYLAVPHPRGWIIRHGYGLLGDAVGRPMTDADLPFAAEVRRTGRHSVHNDLQADAAVRGLPKELGATAGAGVPLVANGEFCGAAAFFRTFPGAFFQPSEINFLDRLAALITLSLQNAALRETEARQRRAAEAAAEQLEQVNAELQAQAEELVVVNERLADESGQLSALLANLPDEVWFADKDGNPVAANRAAVRGLGLADNDEDFLPVPDWRDLEMLRADGTVRPDDEAPIMRTLAGQRVVNQGEIIRHRKTGEWRYRECSGEALRDAAGEIVGAVLVVRDLTEQRAASVTAGRSEAIYRAVAASFPGAALYVFDHDLRYLIVEGEGLALFHQTRAQMEGKTIWEALEPEAIPVVEPRYRRTLAGESLHFETQYGPAYGNIVVAADYRPIRDEAGRVIAGLLVARDLTEHTTLLTRLQSHVAELDGILAALPNGLIVYDPAGVVTRINNVAREMLAYEPDSWKQTVGQRITRNVILRRPDGRPLEWGEYPVIRALRGEELRNETYYMHLPARPDRDCWAVLSATPLRGPTGELLGAAVTLTDVSALHAVRSRLEEANAALQAQAAALQAQAAELRDAKEQLEARVQERTAELGVLLEQMEVNRAQLRALSRRLVELQESERSYVADQLYNQAAQVLAAVRMQLWLLEKHAGPSHPAQAEEGGAALAGMKDALDQTILALHDLATQLRPAGLNRATLTRVLGDYVARMLGSRGVAVRFEPGGTEELRFSNDVVTAVFRTVQEAASNVVRHARATEARLALALEGDMLVVTLSDNGVGFDPATSYNGGVGLIAMRERIESIGGRLSVLSTGSGTTVRIEAPAAAAAAAAAGA